MNRAGQSLPAAAISIPKHGWVGPLQIRCQLVSKAWQHALNPARWPLWHLELLAEHREAVPAVALWLHRVQPGVQRLTVNLSPDLAEVWEGPAWDFSLWDNSPAAEAVHAALLSLQPLSVSSRLPGHVCGWLPNLLSFISCTAPEGSQQTRAPSALQRGQLLRLRATFAVLERFCPILSRFPGLEQLELEVPLLLYSPSVLDKPLLQHLPPQLASLAVTHIDRVHLSPTAAAAGAAAEPSSSAAPALLPALKQLRIGYALSVELDMPLPSLATLTIEGRAGGLVCLAGAGLSLPQLTSLLLLQITYMEERLVVHLHCSAMPALEHLENGGSLLVARDGFEALQQLTRLQMTCNWGAPEHEIDADLLGSVAGSLRSLSLDTVGGIELERQALRMAAAAELERLTQLVGFIC